jgi:hypothetical protein
MASSHVYTKNLFMESKTSVEPVYPSVCPPGTDAISHLISKLASIDISPKPPQRPKHSSKILRDDEEMILEKSLSFGFLEESSLTQRSRGRLPCGISHHFKRNLQEANVISKMLRESRKRTYAAIAEIATSIVDYQIATGQKPPPDKDTNQPSNNLSISATEGERNLYRFIEQFNGHFYYKKEPLYLESFQTLFINAIIPKVAANIVGPSWPVVGPRICRTMGWTPDEFNPVMIGQSPRRFGKTICIALLVANYLVCKAPAEVAVYSTGQRVSGLMQEKIRDILVQSGYNRGSSKTALRSFTSKILRIPMGNCERHSSIPQAR